MHSRKSSRGKVFKDFVTCLVHKSYILQKIHVMKFPASILYKVVLHSRWQCCCTKFQTQHGAVCISPGLRCWWWPLPSGVPSPHWSGPCRMISSEELSHPVREGWESHQYNAKHYFAICLRLLVDKLLIYHVLAHICCNLTFGKYLQVIYRVFLNTSMMAP